LVIETSLYYDARSEKHQIIQHTVVTWQNMHNVHGGWLPTYDKKTPNTKFMVGLQKRCDVRQMVPAGSSRTRPHSLHQNPSSDTPASCRQWRQSQDTRLSSGHALYDQAKVQATLECNRQWRHQSFGITG